MNTAFSGLSALVVEDVTDEGEAIRLSARTREESVPCPMCWMLLWLSSRWNEVGLSGSFRGCGGQGSVDLAGDE
ncbi:hypothetical protein, partial [Streptomyces atratus]|uniref:hypothetical protein n=1 Tax=Streptomyces atratus TaxID=1893 RepID=UPI001E535FCE